MFNNKASCTFKIDVIDKTPPVVENCINPDEFLITQNNTFIEWDEPIFYDNSNLKVNVVRSLDPGFLKAGFYQVIYIATDAFNNSNQCVLNITVKGKFIGKK